MIREWLSEISRRDAELKVMMIKIIAVISFSLTGTAALPLKMVGVVKKWAWPAKFFARLSFKSPPLQNPRSAPDLVSVARTLHIVLMFTIS